MIQDSSFLFLNLNFSEKKTMTTQEKKINGTSDIEEDESLLNLSLDGQHSPSSRSPMRQIEYDWETSSSCSSMVC